MTMLEQRLGSPASVVVLAGDALAGSALDALLTSSGITVEDPERPTAGAVAVLLQPDEATWDLVTRQGLKAVLLSDDEPDDAAVVASVLRGACALLHSDCSPEELLRAIDTVSAEGSALTPRQVASVLAAFRRGSNVTGAVALTPREHQILHAIASGESVKQTARRLGVSPRTIDNTQRVMFLKLGVRNRAHAVSRAHDLGLLDPETP